MAIVIERVSAKVDSSTSVGAAAFTGTPTVGNHIISALVAYGNGGSAATATDNASGGSNTYANDIDRYYSPTLQYSAVLRAKVDRTLSNLQVTLNAQAGVFAGAAIEVSGLESSPLDSTEEADVASNGTYNWDLASDSRTQADELIVASIPFPAVAYGDYALALPAWSGFTPTTIFINDGSSIASEYGSAGALVVSSTSSVTSRMTSNTSGSGTAPIVIATYKGGASGGFTPRSMLLGVG